LCLKQKWETCSGISALRKKRRKRRQFIIGKFS
jgi:hypothetical protein